MSDFDERTVLRIMRELAARRTEIRMPAGEEKAFDEALRRDARVAYRIRRIHWSQTIAETTQTIEYRKDASVLEEDVYHVRKESEMEGLMQFYASCYRKNVVFVVQTGFPFKKVYDDFWVTYASFYANLREIGYKSESFSAIGYEFHTITFSYRISAYKLRQMERELNIAIDGVCREIFLPEMTPQEKAYVAHNYLARTVAYYDKKGATAEELCVQQSAYGAIVKKWCVCQGFAEAYKRLMDLQGIECYVICGHVFGSDTAHAWNMIGFDGKEYFHVDVTWDSFSSGGLSDRWFGGSDAEFSKKRSWERRSYCVAPGKTDLRKQARDSMARNAASYARKGIDKDFLTI